VAPFACSGGCSSRKRKATTIRNIFLVRDDFLGPCPPPTASFWIMATNLAFSGSQVHPGGRSCQSEYSPFNPPPSFSHGSSVTRDYGGGENAALVRITQPEGKPFLTPALSAQDRRTGPPFASSPTAMALKSFCGFNRLPRFWRRNG